MQDMYQSYFEAIQQILNGKPVKELDDIRLQCNEAFQKKALPRVPGQPIGYTPESSTISFIADAENEILMGADPVKVYSGYKGLEPADFRQRGRKILENAVKQHLK